MKCIRQSKLRPTSLHPPPIALWKTANGNGGPAAPPAMATLRTRMTKEMERTSLRSLRRRLCVPMTRFACSAGTIPTMEVMCISIVRWYLIRSRLVVATSQSRNLKQRTTLISLIRTGSPLPLLRPTFYSLATPVTSQRASQPIVQFKRLVFGIMMQSRLRTHTNGRLLLHTHTVRLISSWFTILETLAK